MSTLMLVNPRKRRAGPRKHRTAAQRAATARMVAANKARRGRRSNPIHTVAHAAPARRRRAVAHHVKHRARRRHNPISLRGPLSMLMPALQGAAGAVAVNAAIKYLPLPIMLKSGATANLTKGVLAILLGTFGRKLFGHTAVKMAEGALTVTATNAITQALGKTGLNLGDASGDVAYYAPALQYQHSGAPALGDYQPDYNRDGEMTIGMYQGMGEYMYR
jgi:hypothetical protein